MANAMLDANWSDVIQSIQRALPGCAVSTDDIDGDTMKVSVRCTGDRRPSLMDWFNMNEIEKIAIVQSVIPDATLREKLFAKGALDRMFERSTGWRAVLLEHAIVGCITEYRLHQ